MLQKEWNQNCIMKVSTKYNESINVAVTLATELHERGLDIMQSVWAPHPCSGQGRQWLLHRHLLHLLPFILQYVSTRSVFFFIPLPQLLCTITTTAYLEQVSVCLISAKLRSTRNFKCQLQKYIFKGVSKIQENNILRLQL